MRSFARAFAFFALMGMPALALASGAAGFASQSLFLSQSTITEGGSVTAYANVANDSSAVFSGKIIFDDNGSEIDGVYFSLPPGINKVISTTWKPSAGTHSIIAQLQNASGTALVAEAKAALIVAQLAPVSSDSSNLAVQSSAPIEQAIAGFSPAISSSTAPAFSIIDNARQKASTALANQITQTKKKLPGNIPGISKTSSGSASSQANTPTNGFFSILWTLYFYILTIAQYIIANIAYFYAASLIFILVFLRWLYHRIRPEKAYR